MMTIRQQLRNYQILINDLDVSSCVKEEGSFCEIGCDLWSAGGYFRQTGTLVLLPTRGLTESLDPRINPRFNRGAKVEIRIQQLGGNIFLPYSTLRIIQDPVPPSAENQFLSLQLGDLLDLLDFEQPDGEENEFEVGVQKSRTDLINQLLGSIGGPALIDTISEYPLQYPIYRDNSSVVSQCAQLAWEAGYALWVDPNENVRAINLRKAEIPLKWADFSVKDHAISYAPIDARQAPFEKLRVYGTAYPVEDGVGSTTTITEQPGYLTYWQAGVLIRELGIRRKITRTETIDWNSKRRTIDELTEEPAGLTMMFFVRQNISARDLVTANHTFIEEQYNQDGFLSERITTTKLLPIMIAKGQAWANVYARTKPQKRNDPTQAILVSDLWSTTDPAEVALTQQTALTAIDAKKQTEIWNYDEKQLISSYTSYTEQSYWEVLGDQDIALPGPNLNATRVSLIPSEQIRKSWTKGSGEEWTERQDVERPYLQVLREQADAKLKISELPPPGQKALLVLDGGSSYVKISRTGETQPPQGERIPSPKELGEIDLEVEIEFDPLANPEYRQKLELLQINSAVSEEQLRDLGNIYGTWVLGSQYPYETITYLPDWLLNNPVPIFRIQVTEQPWEAGGSDIKYEAIAQGLSLVLGGDQCLIRWQSVYLGKIENGDVIPTFVQGGRATAIMRMIDSGSPWERFAIALEGTSGLILTEDGSAIIREDA